MKSPLFPLLDKTHISRLLRGGLRISIAENELLRAASILDQLGIIALREVQTIHCANPNDDDFPGDIIDEACEGVIRLVNQAHLMLDGHPVYRCSSCGRFIEYPGTAKQLFPIWETALIAVGLNDYEEAAMRMLTKDSAHHGLSPRTRLSAIDLLTEDRSKLLQRLRQAAPSGRVTHREHGYLQDLRDSLLDAFPSKQSLAQMLKFELGLNLHEIAPDGNLTEIVYEVIVAAQSKGWLPDLIQAARQANRGNERLARYAFEFTKDSPLR